MRPHPGRRVALAGRRGRDRLGLNRIASDKPSSSQVRTNPALRDNCRLAPNPSNTGRH